MKALKLDKTDDTPEVWLDIDKAVFLIAGRSLPEDTVTFFQPVLDWIKAYSTDPNPQTEFTFKLDYFNTASSKLILDLLLALRNIKGIKILWYSQEDDEEIESAGQEFAEQVTIPFEFRTY